MGGLHAGITLQSSKPRLKTIILEKNNYPGGYVSGFRNNGFYFDAGAEGIFEYESGNNRLKLMEYGFDHPIIRVDPTETYYVNGKHVKMYKDFSKFLKEIEAAHPDQVNNVNCFVKTCDQIRQDIVDCGLYDEKITFGKLLKVIFKYPTLRKYAMKNFKDLLQDHNVDESIYEYFNLFCLWLGLKFEEVSATVAAVMISGVFKYGNFYPEGGMDAFARALVQHYVSNGGTFEYKSTVKRIIVKRRKAVGVELIDGTILKAKYVISNADLHRTISDYVGKKHFRKRFFNRVMNLRNSISGFLLFVGVDDYDLTKYPSHFIIGNNTNIVPDVRTKGLNIENIGVRIASNIDPKLRNGNRNSFVVLGFADYKWNNNWKSGHHGKRTKEYRILKKEITEKLISRVETIMKGVSKHIVLKRLSTPLTFDSYNLSSEGSWYGPEYNQKLPNFKTPIRNLFLAGSNVGGAGVNAAMSSGLKTGEFILKLIKRDFLKGRFYPVASAKSKTPQ
ncbi:MAG: NAD(P)/FAD-dependent oxidoreductase, partial [Asgard group archaeon]|nr:NAD(P)/FAD-dependent oxidoreductase [Asgard group archaeon]